jgi:RNA polymerase sigma-70 factor, ECF subfamily
MADTDESLMVAWRDGDPAAFRSLFARFAPIVEKIVRRRIRRDEDVDDLVQQTFLQLHRARRDFRDGHRVRPWLVTIALNVRRGHGRWFLRRREVFLGPDDTPHEAHLPQTLQQLSNRQELGRALAVLSERDRELIELHWLDGMPFPEVAEVMGMSRSAVKVAAHRSYKKMRAALEASS